MDKMYSIYNFEPLWGCWKIDNLIGCGSIGTVYKISRKVYNKKYVSAVKCITVPTKEQEFELENSNRYITKEDKRKYYESMVERIANEIHLLHKLKGNSNIVCYDDHMIRKVPNENKWHIFIKMELVESLSSYIRKRKEKLSENNVLDIMIEICQALDLCHDKKIVHRDIKEDNIFVSKEGKYKLGDFSISKELEGAKNSCTVIGTRFYMAPEQINNLEYDHRVDIYSLGLVAYKLLNGGRFPYHDESEVFSLKVLEKSFGCRMKGEKFPKPCNASEKVANIILKACAYNPEDRYQSVKDLKKDLLKLKRFDSFVEKGFAIDKELYNKSKEIKLTEEDIELFTTMDMPKTTNEKEHVEVKEEHIKYVSEIKENIKEDVLNDEEPSIKDNDVDQISYLDENIDCEKKVLYNLNVVNKMNNIIEKVKNNKKIKNIVVNGVMNSVALLLVILFFFYAGNAGINKSDDINPKTMVVGEDKSNNDLEEFVEKIEEKKLPDENKDESEDENKTYFENEKDKEKDKDSYVFIEKTTLKSTKNKDSLIENDKENIKIDINKKAAKIVDVVEHDIADENISADDPNSRDDIVTAPVNEVINGGGETVDQAWSLINFGESTASMIYSSDYKMTGVNSICIDKTNSNNSSAFHQTVKVVPGKFYKLTYYLKTVGISSNSSKGAGIWLEYDDNGSMSSLSSTEISGNNDWICKTMTMAFPTDSVSLYFGIKKETGTAYFDDISFELADQ